MGANDQKPAASQPSSDEAPSVPSTPDPQTASSRNWLNRWRRITQPTPPDFNPGVDDELATSKSLLDRNPFEIGFFLAIGAMAAYGLVMAFVNLHTVVVLMLLSFAIALGLNPAVTWLHKHGFRRGIAVLFVALAAISVISLAAWALLPVINQQVTLLIEQAPSYLGNLRQNQQIAAIDAQYKIIERAIAFLTSGELISGLFGGLVGAGAAVANVVFSVIITIVLTLYFLITLPSIKEVIYQLAPASRRPRVKYLANEMFQRVGGYVSGLFTIVTIATIVAFIFLNIIGLGEYALALTVVVGLFAFVPLVGPTISTIIMSIVGFALSPTTGLITLIFFLTYQQIDAYLIQPRVFSHSVKIPAVLVMLAAICGGLLLGMIGAILAIPVTAALLLLYREVLVPHLDRT